MKKILKLIYSPYVHFELYALLLIFTPFLMLQNYLQSAIGMASRASFNIGESEIPYLLMIVAIFLSFILLIARKHLNRYRLTAILFTILLMYIGQKSSDFYFNHRFYDLQHNWHYFAYAIYTYLAFRLLRSKGIKTSRIILYTFLSAVSISTFDEWIQVHISSRVFDICDIAKDMWGTIIGMIVIFFIIENGKITKNGWKIRQPKISAYFDHSFSLLFQIIIIAYIFLVAGSLLTDISYTLLAVIITISLYVSIFLSIHLSQKTIIRNLIFAIIGLIIVVQGFFFIKYKNDNIIYNSYGWTIYKGIPIPFFDVMFFPNGSFRPVDKKHYFTTRDQITIKDLAPDILLIGSGNKGLGGRGFPDETVVQFIYNSNTDRGLQIITLRTPDACKVFNKLKSEGFNVLFILHNTC